MTKQEKYEKYRLLKDIKGAKAGEMFIYTDNGDGSYGVSVDTGDQIQTINCLIFALGIDNKDYFRNINLLNEGKQ